MKSKKFAFFLLYVLLFGAINGQTAYNGRASFITEKDIFGTRNFIENKGQFVHPLNPSVKVYFVYQHLDEKIFITENGLLYEITEHLSEKEIHQEPEERAEPKRIYVIAEWENHKEDISD